MFLFIAFLILNLSLTAFFDLKTLSSYAIVKEGTALSVKGGRSLNNIVRIDGISLSPQVIAIAAFMIVLLLWLYMSSLMLLIGGQLNVTVGEAMRRSKQPSGKIAEP